MNNSIAHLLHEKLMKFKNYSEKQFLVGSTFSTRVICWSCRSVNRLYDLLFSNLSEF